MSEAPYVFDLITSAPNGAPVFTQSIKNENVPPHRHSYIEFFYVFDGGGTQILNGAESHIESGHACLLSLNDVHRFLKNENGPFMRRDILISTAFFKGVCDSLSKTLFDDIQGSEYVREIVLSSEEIYTIESYVPYLFLEPDDEDYLFHAKALTSYLINLIITYNLKQKRTAIPSWLSNLATRLSSYGNFRTDCSELIQDIAFTPDYIRRMFKKCFGMTMTDYFNRQKINYAYFLLKKTNYSIEVICEQIGFTNIPYFYKLFKKIIHITPSKVRKENQAEIVKQPQ